jgi:hypothetical protein
MIAVIKDTRHPGRAAACNDAAQVRDRSPQVPCLQRTAARCAAHGMTGRVIKGDRHPGRAAARSAAAQVRDLSHEVPCLQRSIACCAAHGMTGLGCPNRRALFLKFPIFSRAAPRKGALSPRQMGRLFRPLHARHPGRAAARSAAAQVRDRSHEVPCLQRTLARCAAHGMTGRVIKSDRHPGRAAACNDAAQVRDRSPQVPCLQRSIACCAAHGMTHLTH